MNVLAVDTSGPVAGVALNADGLEFVRIARTVRGTEGLLVPWAIELVHEAGLTLSDLDGIAVVHGPGAFTGLRVGLATALGLATSLDLPLWWTDSLLPRARRTGQEPVLAMLDARKGRVYATWFDGEATVGPADVAPQVALSWATPPFVATGEGAIVYADLVQQAGGTVLPDADDPGVLALASLAAAAFARGEGARDAAIAPLYLRDADAKLPKR